jgi:hypothetical protein
VQVVDEQDDVGPGVGSPDADMAEPAAGAEVKSACQHSFGSSAANRM